MSVTAFARLGTSNAYDSTIANLQSRQNNLSNLQESLSSGKKINTPSDDPTGAAQAERALNRMARIATDQRALEVQRNSIASAESTLGDITSALQDARDLVASAGNGSFSNAERKTVANQIAGLRERILSLANTQDSNNQPLFAALGSALAPFVGPTGATPDYSFSGLAGTASGSTYAIAPALDGDSAFMLQPTRDAAYNVAVSNASGNLISSNVTRDPAAGTIDGHAYAVQIDGFNAGAGTVDYTVTDTTTGTALTPQTGVPWTSALGFAVSMPGLALQVKGTPTAGDSLTVQPNSSIFGTLDNAVNAIGAATNSNQASQAVGQALHNIDISMARISAVRGQAGDLLNRADSITGTNENRTIEQKANQSRAEDVDMIQAVSDFQKQQTGYQAALQSYAQIQKLSLFNFIS
jgi:flagellar hook-associated protein 3 FlgL